MEKNPVKVEKNPVCVEKNPVKMEKNIAWIPVLEAYVTHWQELETHARVQQWQKQEQEDHNFRHGAEN